MQRNSIFFTLVLQLFGSFLIAGHMANTGIIESEGFNLGYRIEGTGANALVIGSSIYYPRIFSNNLRQHFRFIFADMRAFAPSQTLKSPLSFGLDLILDDVERMRQKLKLGRVIIIGHSGNAFLALEYAKRYPEHVSHVVMIGTGPDFSAQSKEAADQYWEEFASVDRKTALQKSLEKYPDSQYEQIPLNQRFIWNYTRNGARIWYDFNFDSTPLWKDVHVNMPIFDYIWGTLFRDIDITRGLETLDKPVFLGLGRYDFIVAPPVSWDSLKPKFKNLTIHIFEKSGHSPFYEEPQDFDERLLEWVASH
jgi:proline iminopeptidase